MLRCIAAAALVAIATGAKAEYTAKAHSTASSLYSEKMAGMQEEEAALLVRFSIFYLYIVARFTDLRRFDSKCVS